MNCCIFPPNKIKSFVPFDHTLKAALRQPLARFHARAVPVDQVVRPHADHESVHEARTVRLVAQNIAVFHVVAQTVFVPLDNERNCPRWGAGTLNDFIYHVFRYFVQVLCERIFYCLLKSIIFRVQELSILVTHVDHQLFDKLRLRFVRLLFLCSFAIANIDRCRNAHHFTLKLSVQRLFQLQICLRLL